MRDNDVPPHSNSFISESAPLCCDVHVGLIIMSVCTVRMSIIIYMQNILAFAEANDKRSIFSEKQNAIELTRASTELECFSEHQQVIKGVITRKALGSLSQPISPKRSKKQVDVI